MKFIGIGGEPATGKSTLVKEVIVRFSGPTVILDKGRVKGVRLGYDGIWVVGNGYLTGHPFPGTDRLHMGVQYEFEDFMKHTAKQEGSILFEGDRLFIEKNFILAKELGFEVYPIFLTAADNTLKARHTARNDRQRETWLKGRKTKYQNLLKKVPEAIVLENETEEDMWHNFHKVTNFIYEHRVIKKQEEGNV